MLMQWKLGQLQWGPLGCFGQCYLNYLFNTAVMLASHHAANVVENNKGVAALIPHFLPY